MPTLRQAEWRLYILSPVTEPDRQEAPKTCALQHYSGVRKAPTRGRLELLEMMSCSILNFSASLPPAYPESEPSRSEKIPYLGSGYGERFALAHLSARALGPRSTLPGHSPPSTPKTTQDHKLHNSAACTLRFPDETPSCARRVNLDLGSHWKAQDVVRTGASRRKRHHLPTHGSGFHEAPIEAELLHTDRHRILAPMPDSRHCRNPVNLEES